MMNAKTLKNYYLIVGQKYAEDPHPLSLHPDGWARVTAYDYRQAREYVVSLCGAK
jgi:hypothetical protein